MVRYKPNLPRFILLLSILLNLFCLTPAWSFYEKETEFHYLDVRALLRPYAVHQYISETNLFQQDKNESGVAAVARLLVSGEYRDTDRILMDSSLSYEINLLQNYIPNNLVTASPLNGQKTVVDVQRSDALEWSLSDSRFAHFLVDRLQITWQWQKLGLSLGRQPINLATTFFFTPNDFFAPFAAQNFYRVYKSGVDSIRTDLELSPLSQLSVIFVAGYGRDLDSENGWSDTVESKNNSLVLRYENVYGDFQWAVLMAEIEEKELLGFSLQGEILQWLGIRAEGHHGHDRLLDRTANELALGLEHRWENSLTANLEFFYHGSGADNKQDYWRIAQRQDSIYLAQRYMAVSISYEFTPLLVGDFLVLENLLDHSRLLAFNTVYSLADEAELVASVTIPLGEKSQQLVIESEYGLVANSLNVEIRWYF